MGMTRMYSRGFLDGKKLWEVYTGLGAGASLRVLAEWARQNGMVNPMTGEITKMGVYFAMWRYAITHPEEAYPAYRNWMMEMYKFKMDVPPTFETFTHDLYNHAKTRTEIISKTKLNEFVKKYNIQTGQTSQTN